MKRASEVPPVVDRLGWRPVTSTMIFATSPTNAPGSVRNTSELDGAKSRRQRIVS